MNLSVKCRPGFVEGPSEICARSFQRPAVRLRYTGPAMKYGADKELLDGIAARIEESGAALIEYSILIGLIAAAVVTTVAAIGVWITGRWSTLKAALGA